MLAMLTVVADEAQVREQRRLGDKLGGLLRGSEIQNHWQPSHTFQERPEPARGFPFLFPHRSVDHLGDPTADAGLFRPALLARSNRLAARVLAE